jgi:hypothetical protein
MARREKLISFHPLSFDEALRGILAVGAPPGKPEPAKAHQKRQPTTRKAKSAKAGKKKRKKP